MAGSEIPHRRQRRNSSLARKDERHLKDARFRDVNLFIFPANADNHPAARWIL